MNFIEYPKINTIFKRDSKTKKIIIGDYSLPEFDYLKNNMWDWSEKIDGTNVRVLWDHIEKKIIFGGRTEAAQMPVELITRLQELFPVDKMQELFPETSIVLFGEGYGRKIQKVGSLYKKDGVDFILFDILIGGWWLRREDVNGIATKIGIKSVPIIGKGNFDEAIKFVSNGFNSTFGEFQAEGIVLRPTVELFARNRSRIIAKLKYRDFI